MVAATDAIRNVAEQRSDKIDGLERRLEEAIRGRQDVVDKLMAAESQLAVAVRAFLTNIPRVRGLCFSCLRIPPKLDGCRDGDDALTRQVEAGERLREQAHGESMQSIREKEALRGIAVQLQNDSVPMSRLEEVAASRDPQCLVLSVATVSRH